MTIANRTEVQEQEPTWWLAGAIGEENAEKVNDGFFRNTGVVANNITIAATLVAIKIFGEYVIAVAPTVVAATVTVATGPVGIAIAGLGALAGVGHIAKEVFNIPPDPTTQSVREDASND